MRGVGSFLFFLLFSGLNGANVACAMQNDKIFVRNKFIKRTEDPLGFWFSSFLALVFTFGGVLGIFTAMGLL